MQLNRNTVNGGKKYTERVIQFGEGNFLRAFVDWQLDLINQKTDFDAGVVVVRPLDTTFPPSLNTQDGVYTTIIRGLNGQSTVRKDYRVITSVNREVNVYREFDQFLALARDENFRYIFSNTTEAGIAFDPADRFEFEPPLTYPGKLTRLLFERFTHFQGDAARGFIIIPCELIDDNGRRLRQVILQYIDLWQLGAAFRQWVEAANLFVTTLVDRIVPGYPAAEKDELAGELGYIDNFMVAGEYFHLFVMQGPAWLAEEFRVKEAGVNIKVVDNLKPYKTRKVGILNGAHTAMVPVAYLYGLNGVKETVEHELLGRYVRETIYDEIIPALDMERAELVEFAEAVINRFRNPYLHHQLMAISLNSMTKFRTRILPQLLTYYHLYHRLPRRLVFSLAALLRFYKGERLGRPIDLKDDAHILELYRGLWAGYDGTPAGATTIAGAVLGYERLWETDLREVPGLTDMVADYLYKIDSGGLPEALKEVL
jgi:tagaturonate reductase